jgi:cell division protein FtsA
VTLDEIIVAVSGGRLKSQNFVATADVEGGAVTPEHIERAIDGGRAYAERDGRTLLHLGRLGYRLDGVSGMRDPRGMAAKRLGADLHAVTIDDGPIRNLLLLIERCYLRTAGVIPAGLAAGLGATTTEERRIGVTCVDIGGGSTTLSVFAEGHFLYTSTLPVGGSHITYDIARNLKTPLAEAERIKALYGTLVGAQSDEHEFISFPLAGEGDGAMHQTTKARLTSIIRPRFEGLMASVREHMEEGGVLSFAGENIVLTGGASQMIGAVEFAARQMGLPVRIGKPQSLSGLPPALSGPAFSCLAGLLPAGVIAGSESSATRERDHLAKGYLGRVGQWLREGL